MDPAREVAQLGQRRSRLAARLGQQLARLRGSLSSLSSAMPEAHRERDEPRLRAVVQVALDPLQLGRLRVDRAGARGREDVDALGQLLAARRAQQRHHHRQLQARQTAHDQPADGDQQQAGAGGARAPSRSVSTSVKPNDVGGFGAQYQMRQRDQVEDRAPQRQHDDRQHEAEHAADARPGEVLPRRRVGGGGAQPREPAGARLAAAVALRRSARRARAPRGAARSARTSGTARRRPAPRAARRR